MSAICCRDVGERLLGFRDGTLPPDETEWLRQHLHLCPNCMTLLQSYDAMLDVLERLKPVNMPPGVLERIQKSLEHGTGGCC